MRSAPPLRGGRAPDGRRGCARCWRVSKSGYYEWRRPAGQRAETRRRRADMVGALRRGLRRDLTATGRRRTTLRPAALANGSGRPLAPQATRETGPTPAGADGCSGRLTALAATWHAPDTVRRPGRSATLNCRATGNKVVSVRPPTSEHGQGGRTLAPLIDCLDLRAATRYALARPRRTQPRVDAVDMATRTDELEAGIGLTDSDRGTNTRRPNTGKIGRAGSSRHRLGRTVTLRTALAEPLFAEFEDERSIIMVAPDPEAAKEEHIARHTRSRFENDSTDLDPRTRPAPETRTSPHRVP